MCEVLWTMTVIITRELLGQWYIPGTAGILYPGIIITLY